MNRSGLLPSAKLISALNLLLALGILGATVTFVRIVDNSGYTVNNLFIIGGFGGAGVVFVAGFCGIVGAWKRSGLLVAVQTCVSVLETLAAAWLIAAFMLGFYVDFDTLCWQVCRECRQSVCRNTAKVFASFASALLTVTGIIFTTVLVKTCSRLWESGDSARSGLLLPNASESYYSAPTVQQPQTIFYQARPSH